MPPASAADCSSPGGGLKALTCWRRLRDWQAAGVFERLHRALLDRLGRANAVDFEPLLARQRLLSGKKSGECIGPNPTDPGKPGTKRHVLVDVGGRPPRPEAERRRTRTDSTVLEPVLDAVSPVRQ